MAGSIDSRGSSSNIPLADVTNRPAVRRLEPTQVQIVNAVGTSVQVLGHRDPRTSEVFVETTPNRGFVNPRGNQRLLAPFAPVAPPGNGFHGHFSGHSAIPTTTSQQLPPVPVANPRAAVAERPASPPARFPPGNQSVRTSGLKVRFQLPGYNPKPRLVTTANPATPAPAPGVTRLIQKKRPRADTPRPVAIPSVLQELCRAKEREQQQAAQHREDVGQRLQWEARYKALEEKLELYKAELIFERQVNHGLKNVFRTGLKLEDNQSVSTTSKVDLTDE